ncbi:unnamed protein product [Clonostachys rosea]|uniref:Replication protein A C-terminal domain-containing protein n=1 Tax=Bionectria ochroleuca TaxID=29856 RepID=A0ABY6U1H3_BIOOC|nr:unnamed protein product [Clonostachys rosea]
MSAYGNQYKSGFGGQNDDGGGFFAGSSQQGSQGGGQARQEKSLRPVTIKQIQDAEAVPGGEHFKIDGATIDQITIVAQVRSVSARPTHLLAQLDDGTAQCDVRMFTNEEAKVSETSYEPNSFVRVFGILRSFNDKPSITAYSMRAVPDYNEVNYHLLEATYTHLYFTRGPLDQEGRAGNEEPSMFVGGAGGGAGGASAGNNSDSKLGNCSQNARKFFNFLSNVQGNEGANINAIANQLQFTMSEALKASEELYSQGVIYNTIDDETWAILEYD